MDKKGKKNPFISRIKHLSRLQAGIGISAIAVAVLALVGVGMLIGRGDETRDYFETLTPNVLQITQVNRDTYTLALDLQEEDGTPVTDAEFYLSTYDKLDDNAKPFEGEYIQDIYTAENYAISAGDYYLYAVRGEDTFQFPFTIPEMSPKIWMNGTKPTIEFEIDGAIGWSSFIDNEGKSVYRSADTTFNENAKALVENLSITEGSYRDDNPSSDEPYYYVMLTGKSGKSVYVTAPLFYHATQTNLSAKFYEEDGAAFLTLEGNIYGTTKTAERTISLRVGNYDWADATSTSMVENTASGDDNTKFKFDIPLADLDEGTNNMSLFLEENGTMLEWSILGADLDLDAMTLETELAKYSLQNPDGLQIQKQTLAFETISAELKNDAQGNATMQISGKLRETIGEEDDTYTLIVKTSDETEAYEVENAGTGRNISYSFTLEQLQQKNVWYDVEVRVKSSNTAYSIPYSKAAGTAKELKTENREYLFQAWNDILKISFEPNREFDKLTSYMAQEKGVPYLYVTGTCKDLAADEFYLGIRSGEEVVKTANSATEDGTFSFRYDMSKLTKRSVWYDVTIGVKSDEKLYDVSTGSVSDMDAALSVNDLTYGFRAWEDDLKIQYDYASSIYKDVSASMETIGGKSALVVTGTIRYVDANNAFLAIRNGDGVTRAQNSSGSSTQFRFVYDLSQLTQTDVWYDVLLGNAEQDGLVDLQTASADMDSSLTDGVYVYRFAEWNGDLKIYRGLNEDFISSVKTTFKTKDGVPYLAVKGSSKLAQEGMHLRVRSGDEVIDVANTSGSTTNFEFLFDLTKLTQRNIWYDLLIGNKAGALANIPVAAADMSSTLKNAGEAYGFAEWDGDLKVYRTADEDFISTVSAKLTLENNIPYLVVEGTSKAEHDGMYLRIRSGDKTLDVKNSLSSDTKFKFRFDLRNLSARDVWYDVLIGNEAGALANVPVSAADLSSELSGATDKYCFAEWDGDLKVYYTWSEQFVDSIKSTLLLENNTPYLVVEGTSSTAQEGMYLRVRSGDKVIDVTNSLSSTRKFKFKFDLTQLSKADNWYDILIGNAAGALTDVTTSTADVSSTISTDTRKYGFAEWNGDLKIYYSVIEQLADTVTAALQLEGSTPYLVVEGTTATAQKGMYLRIRTGDTVIDTANSLSSTKKFKFKFDLTQLSKADNWYDVLIGNAAGTLTDLTTSAADMNSTLASADRNYCFAEWSGDLKVYYTVTEQIADSIAATLQIVDNTPYLVVEGTSKTAQEGMFLRIGNSGAVIADITNSLPSKTEFKFQYDLTQLPSDDTWYDVKIGNASGTIVDLTTSAADMSSTITSDMKKYSFEQWSGDLKVYRSAADLSLDGTQVSIELSGGLPVLLVEGTLDGIDTSGMQLGVGIGSDILYETNSASQFGSFKFSFDLRQLEQQDTWYDLLVVLSGNTYNLKTDYAADYSMHVTYNSLIYGFKQSGGDLKVNCTGSVSSLPGAEVTSDNIYLTKESGTVYLNIKGSVALTGSDKQVYLKISDTDNNLWTKTVYATVSDDTYVIKTDITDYPANGHYLDMKLYASRITDGYTITSLIELAAGSDIVTDLNTTQQTISDKVYGFEQRYGELRLYIYYQ